MVSARAQAMLAAKAGAIARQPLTAGVHPLRGCLAGATAVS